MDPSAIDLVTLEQVKAWVGIAEENTDEDDTIQFLITGFSQYVINITGRSSFNNVATFTEVYDGNGAQRMFLLNSPITNVTSVTTSTTTFPMSTGLGSPGVYIEQSGKSIALRAASGRFTYTGFLFPLCFPAGMGNIQVVYSAGYAEVPFDLQEAAMKAVGINYRRKDWIDLASKSLSTQSGTMGTTKYRDWALPPEIIKVLDIYSRYARP